MATVSNFQTATTNKLLGVLHYSQEPWNMQHHHHHVPHHSSPTPQHYFHNSKPMHNSQSPYPRQPPTVSPTPRKRTRTQFESTNPNPVNTFLNPNKSLCMPQHHHYLNNKAFLNPSKPNPNNNPSQPRHLQSFAPAPPPLNLGHTMQPHNVILPSRVAPVVRQQLPLPTHTAVPNNLAVLQQQKQPFSLCSQAVMSSPVSVVAQTQQFPCPQTKPNHQLLDGGGSGAAAALISSLLNQGVGGGGAAALISSLLNQGGGGAAAAALISSLLNQGLIALPKQTPIEEDPIGLEFDPDKLKVRHETVISALYGDLQRQSATCGLRFKTQEEHSSHMDWHVRKNRAVKGQQKQKLKPSRSWLVSANMWLAGAEASAKNEGPKFLQNETNEEEVKGADEFTVSADEDQRSCALCGEAFEEFFSHEADDWLYKGAVYLNAPKGSVGGLDKSLFGPIVHAKCRS